MFEFIHCLLRIRQPPSKLCNIIRFQKERELLNTTCLQLSAVPSRTTVIVKRKFPVRLYKEGEKPRIARRNNYYEVEDNTENKPDSLIDIVLTSYVSGVGNPGDIISLKRMAAYHKYILPGLAVYPTEENLEFARRFKTEQTQKNIATPSEEFTLQFLKNRWISIVMNKETEWTLEPWHVRASFRKGGIHISSDSCIELPPHPIKGPNMDLEGKEFFVTITVNKKHKVKVRCLIHHWSTEITDKLPYVQDYWANPTGELFPSESTKDTNDPANKST